MEVRILPRASVGTFEPFFLEGCFSSRVLRTSNDGFALPEKCKARLGYYLIDVFRPGAERIVSPRNQMLTTKGIRAGTEVGKPW